MPRSDAPMGFAFPRPGPGLKAVLALVAVVGILEALLVNWVGFHEAFHALACVPSAVLHGEAWRLLTAGVLSDVDHPSGLIFNLIGLYFLSTDLEARWGTRRFLVFLGACVVAGNTLAILVDVAAPAGLRLLHPQLIYGPGAALTGTAIAWSIYNRFANVLLMMVLPVSGRTLFWITILGCGLYLLFTGDVTGFGGVFVGLGLSGEPSPMRRAYLNVKLALLRRGKGGPTAHDIATGRAKPRRAGGPDLRVVQGGREPDEKGEKREPPKDKRYLN
jgi:membrane associated rhomboid family serine protease